ncbi:hypothetical protein G6F37_002151 [Rhizopus arrhizus]|nr:hypothetical protein G6F38_002870 [Rhizopus arrhizus]KAG1162440.1 hypothetical protein G6F37_002151 [Rhizopus arrhizus]
MTSESNISKQSSIRSAISSSNNSIRKLFHKFPKDTSSSISSTEPEGGPSQTQIDLIRLSWEHVSQTRLTTDDPNISPSHAFGLAFYEALFELCPEVETLFHDVIQQARAFTGMIAYIARAPTLTKEKKGTTIKDMNTKKVEEEDSEWLAMQMRELGARHYFYEIKPMHFDLVGPAFVIALKKRMGKEYTEETGDAWIKAAAYVAHHMTIGFESQRDWEKGGPLKKIRRSKQPCTIQ